MVKEDHQTSTMSSFSSSCSQFPVALEGPSTFISSSCSSSSSSSLRPSRRRPRRVLYPASRSRRPPLREAPDQARRWLLILSALIFLQIYTEEACTELQHQDQDSAASQPQEGEGSLGPVQGWTGEEPWRLQVVDGASETQLECVVV